MTAAVLPRRSFARAVLESAAMAPSFTRLLLSLSAPLVLTVAFEKNPYMLRANNYDQVHLYVYCPGINQGYLAAPVYRKDRRISVSLPDAMLGHELHLYAFATDEQGRASDTSYAGWSDSSDQSDKEKTLNLGEIEHLEGLGFAVVNGETDEGGDLVEALPPGSPGVDMQ